VTAFPALNPSSSTSYTSYSSVTSSSLVASMASNQQPPKVPGSPTCISPDSTTMVGPHGFEASLYDEFLSSGSTSKSRGYHTSQPQQPQNQHQHYLLPQQTTTSSIKAQPYHSRYYIPSQENFVLHNQSGHGQTSTSGSSGRLTAGTSSLHPVALLTRTGNSSGASVSNTLVSSTTPTSSSSAASEAENDDEGIGSSLADLDSLTDLLPMMAPDLVTCIKGDLDEAEQPTTSSSTASTASNWPPENNQVQNYHSNSMQSQSQPQNSTSQNSTQRGLSLTSLNSASHLDFNCSPELTNLLLSDFGVTNSDAQWLDDNLVKL
jgi:hypothetical protein